MIINLETGENCQATLRVEVPAETVTSERHLIASQFVKEARIPGYRKGKVPLRVVEKRYGKAIKAELEKRLSKQVVTEASRKKNIRILQIRKQDFSENSDETVSVTADLILMPTINLPDYKGLTATVPKVEVTDERVDDAIRLVRKRQANYVDVEADTPITMGLYAVIDISATLDGEPLTSEGDRVRAHYFDRKGVMFHIAESTFLLGFCQQLIDHKVGENVKFKFILPESFEIEELRGKEVEYDVKINEVKREELPELTDEWVKEVMGDPEATKDSFHDTVRKELIQHSEESIGNYKEKILINQLLQQVDFDLPSALVANSAQEKVSRIVKNLQNRKVSDEEIKSQEMPIVQVATNEATKELRTHFLLREISRTEGIKATTEEINVRIGQYAANANVPFEKAYKSFEKNGKLESVAQEVLFAKTLYFLTENAQFNVDDSTNILDVPQDA